jgi:predicted amidohydrolase
VPLTLSRMPRDCDYGVFEIGMNHAGEIAPLARMVRPHVAIITTVEAVHIEHFQSVAAIADAKAAGCTFRTGPELEITGYGCEDSFLEPDTFAHSWESLGQLLSTDLTDGILCDIGMPVLHRNVSYNCRVIVLDRRVLGVRPKLCLANDGNYREMRYFTPWYVDPTSSGLGQLQEYFLPRVIRQITGQVKVPIGIFAIAAADTAVGFESCEELFTPRATHIALSLNGVEIIANGSGSHHQLRKLQTRIDLVRGATDKSGGVYLYANQKGCDGGRLYFDGCAMVWVNGALVAQGSQFDGLDEVEVVVATVSLADVRAKRANFISRSFQVMGCRGCVGGNAWREGGASKGGGMCWCRVCQLWLLHPFLCQAASSAFPSPIPPPSPPPFRQAAS